LRRRDIERIIRNGFDGAIFDSVTKILEGLLLREV
jgi:hypothetical protein